MAKPRRKDTAPQNKRTVNFATVSAYACTAAAARGNTSLATATIPATASAGTGSFDAAAATEKIHTHTHNTYTHRHIHTPTQHSTAQHNDGVRRDGGGVHGEGAAHITAAERSVPGRRERETKEKGGGPGSTAVSDANAAHCRRRCGCRRCRHLTQTTATTKSLNLAGKQAGNNGHPPTRTTSHVRQAAQSGGKSGFCSPHSGPRHAVTAAPTMPPHA